MTVIIYLVFVLFSVLLLKNYRLAIYTLSGWCLLIQEIIFPGVPLNLFDILAIEALVIFLWKKPKHSRMFYTYPFILPTILLILSLLMTNYVGAVKHWPTMIGFSISNYIFPILLWNMVTTKEDVMRFTKISICFFFILTAYGIIEVLLGYNPLIRWMISTNSFAGNIIDSDRFRFGFKRIQSFMVMNGALGVSCSLFFLFLSYINNEMKGFWGNNKHLSILPILLLLNILFTGTRSCYVTFAITLLYFAQMKILKSTKFYLLCIVILAIAVTNGDLLNEILNSFSDTESVSGSNSDMRANQFATAMYFMNQNLFFGNGYNYTYEYVAVNFHNDILGAESVWFPLMIDQGLFGVITYAFFAFFCLVYCFKKKNKACFFMTLAFFVAKTLTTVSGMNKAYFLIYLVVMFRASIIKNNSFKEKRL